MLDSAFKGKASILNISSIGIMDAAMVCESMDGQPAALDITSSAAPSQWRSSGAR